LKPALVEYFLKEGLKDLFGVVAVPKQTFFLDNVAGAWPQLSLKSIMGHNDVAPYDALHSGDPTVRLWNFQIIL
jgi:hypothetical protein